MERSCEEYLAKIRRTIAESRQMVESVKLRFAETDRMLEESGTSREEVAKMKFTPEQRAAVNEELVRRGMPPLEHPEKVLAPFAPPTSPIAFGNSDMTEDIENRRRKFGAMMKRFKM